MCRLAAWLGPEIPLEDILIKPSHSLIEQSQHATQAKLSVNGDGFGFAWYRDDGELGQYRAVMPAWADNNLPVLAKMITSHLFIAHVRASTFGEVSPSNCHPFISENWSFAHNGQIANFTLHRRQLEATLTNRRYAEKTGNTDSELLFLLLLDHGLANDPQQACCTVLDLIKNITGKSSQPTRIAAVFSDGRKLYALRYSSDTKSPSLYYSRNSTGGLAISSEPLNEPSGKKAGPSLKPQLHLSAIKDNEREQWSLVPDSTLLVADSEHTTYVALH